MTRFSASAGPAVSTLLCRTTQAGVDSRGDRRKSHVRDGQRRNVAAEAADGFTNILRLPGGRCAGLIAARPIDLGSRHLDAPPGQTAWTTCRAAFAVGPTRGDEFFRTIHA